MKQTIHNHIYYVKLTAMLIIHSSGTLCSMAYALGMIIHHGMQTLLNYAQYMPFFHILIESEPSS